MSPTLMDTKNRGRLLTYWEAGELFPALGERFIQRLVREKRIPVYRLSPRKVRVAEQDLLDWIEKHREDPGEMR
jgi:excisionase family DNA binding protein